MNRVLTITSSYDPRNSRLNIILMIEVLFKYSSGIVIAYNTGASLEKCLPVLQNDRPDCDAAVMRSVESEIADNAGIKPPARLFQFGNDLHRTDFWRAGHGARWKRRANGIECVLVLAQPRHNVRDNVHDVTLTVDHHLLGDLNAAELRHAA